jgi:hypothetical protein
MLIFNSWYTAGKSNIYTVDDNGAYLQCLTIRKSSMTDNASIYISDPSLLGAKFLKTFSEIKAYQGLQKGTQAAGLKLDLSICQIQMNFMPPDQIPNHLNGLEGYVKKMGCANNDKLLYALSRIGHVRFVIGCVINPGFDKNGQTIQFLGNFTSGLNGLLFVHNSLLDYDGEALAGPLRTP